MIQTNIARESGWARAWVGAAALVFVLTLGLSWFAQRRLEASFERLDARTLDGAARLLDSHFAHQREQLAATVGVLSEDSRIRAMVLTPTFDRATVMDLLTDLKATSGATMVALLDAAGVVRAVAGAPEMDQLDLGTSSLVKDALEKPSARLWAFADEVGVLAAAPVRVDRQVQALFMLGFALPDSVLLDIEQALGASSAILVGERIVASASTAPERERALRAAAELPPGAHRVIGQQFLASSSPLSDTAVGSKVAWLLPLGRSAGEVAFLRALAWLPVGLVAIVLGCMLGLVLSQSRRSQYPGG